jgi:hypothetical protein
MSLTADLDAVADRIRMNKLAGKPLDAGLDAVRQHEWWLDTSRHLTNSKRAAITDEQRDARRRKQGREAVSRGRERAKTKTKIAVRADDPLWVRPVGEALAAARTDLPPQANPLAERYRRRLEGLRRFVAHGWHEKAMERGWTADELYGASGAVWFLELDQVLYVTDDLIMAKSSAGMSLPIYKGAWL